ncbi:MAG: hypothetical protein U0326_06470 [Polyangiales bacterium]
MVPTVPSETVTEEYKTVPDGRYGTVSSEPSDAGARETSARADALTAERLAALLDDHANLAFYRTLIATTDVAALATALTETLARRHELRGRPGAYFTAIVRRVTHPTPYV